MYASMAAIAEAVGPVPFGLSRIQTNTSTNTNTNTNATNMTTTREVDATPATTASATTNVAKPTTPAPPATPSTGVGWGLTSETPLTKYLLTTLCQLRSRLRESERGAYTPLSKDTCATCGEKFHNRSLLFKHLRGLRQPNCQGKMVESGLGHAPLQVLECKPLGGVPLNHQPKPKPKPKPTPAVVAAATVPPPANTTLSGGAAAAEPAEDWFCPSCTMLNQITTRRCTACRTRRPAGLAPPPVPPTPAPAPAQEQEEEAAGGVFDLKGTLKKASKCSTHMQQFFEHLLKFSTPEVLITGQPPAIFDVGALSNLKHRGLATAVESGETILYVLVATLAMTKPNSEARTTLLEYLHTLTDTPAGEAQVAAFMTVRPLDTRNGRDVWGFTAPPNELVKGMASSAIAIARATDDVEVMSALILPPRGCSGGGGGGSGGHISPAGAVASADAVCEVCYDSSLHCCEAGGRMCRVSDARGCGHVVCPAAASRWIATQVEENRGIGEIVCPCCPNVLTSHEVCKLTTRAVFERADQMALEKALLAMNSKDEVWVWCPGGCGGGGYGARKSDGCMTYVCPDAACGLEFCASPGCAVPLSHHTRPAMPPVPAAVAAKVGSVKAGGFGSGGGGGGGCGTGSTRRRWRQPTPDDAASTHPIPPELGFNTGSRVIINGLTSASGARYNGMVATVCTGIYNNGYVGVWLDTLKKGIKVKPDNFKIQGAAKAEASRGATAEAATTHERGAAAEAAAQETVQAKCVPKGHIWVSCETAQGQKKSAEYLASKTKACPGCGVMTARDGGCSHMSCKICKFEWCWLCNGKYKPGRYTMGNKCPC